MLFISGGCFDGKFDLDCFGGIVLFIDRIFAKCCIECDHEYIFDGKIWDS